MKVGRRLWQSWSWLVGNLRWLVVAVAVFAGALFRGRQQGREQEQERQRSEHNEAKAEALQTREQIREDVANTERERILDRLRERADR